MSVTPYDILDYIVKEGLEADFLTRIALHKGGYSIGEIGDKRFVNRDGKCKLISKAYNINIEIDDEEIKAAIINDMYITPFISRKDEVYQIHFLVHKCKADMKNRFEDDITKEVVNYMLLKTIVALRLDTPQKVKAFISD